MEGYWHSMERLALGRVGGVGDLYDARTECFCGGSIFGQSKEMMPSGVIESMDRPYSDYQIIATKAYSEMFKGFGVDGELKASFLAGMVGLQGSMAFLKDLKTGSRCANSTLKFVAGTKYESLNMSHEGLPQCLSMDVLATDKGQATHFVAGVQWGVQAYASVESESGMDMHAKGIDVKLSARLSELGAALVQLCGGYGVSAVKPGFGGNKGRNAIDGEEKFKFTVKADVVLDSSQIPRNFEEAFALLSTIPAQVVHNARQGQGTPLWFTLCPLSQLEVRLPPNVQLPFSMERHCTSVASSAIEALERLYEELQSTNQALHDLYEDVCNHHSTAFTSHDKERIRTYRENMKAAEGQLQAAVRKQVIAIRSGASESAGLEKILSEFSTQSEIAPSKAQDFMDPYACKLRSIINCKEQGVQFVLQSSASPQSFPMPRNIGTSTWVVILTYSEKIDKTQQEFNNNWNTFWHLHAQSRYGQDFDADPAVTDISFYLQEINQDGECTCKTRVSVYKDGELVSEDTALLMLGNPHSSKPEKNLVYSSVKHELNMHAPNARIPLQTYCPGNHVHSSCAKDTITDWACERCNHYIENGKDGFLYCKCGRAPVRACRFRCCSQKHGPLFVAFPAKDVEQILMRQEVPQQLNILLLGETGVGKSTFINALANYLTFDTLESAINSGEELASLIPMAFTHTDPVTCETREFKFGHPDPNEIHQEGQSATQKCRSYTINVNPHPIVVHLIDTPGVGDTRGIDYDEENFQNILSYLNHYTEIHGICVMLKPNTTRLTVTFRFCIKELLRHLHKSASENIVFLFTNARGTFYSAGDTVVPLQKMLRDIKDSPPHVQIALNQRTMYCMDNEAFRYLVASKQGYIFPPECKASYAESWIKSSDQCSRMWAHFQTLKPHNVKETVSLNKAWNLVFKLQKPLEDVTNAIQLNLTKWEALKKEVEDFQGSDIRELKDIVKGDEVLHLEPVAFKKGARTVCNSTESCCEMRESVNGEVEKFYKQVCHEPCKSSKVVRVFAPGKVLYFCKAMDRNGVCKVCKCNYKHHTRITYNAKLIRRKISNKATDKLHDMINTKNIIEAKKVKISELEQRYREWKEELEAITQACARFAHFFKNNAITPFNDDMKDYVHHQIAVVEAASGHNKAKLVDRWKAFLEEYQRQMDGLERMSTDIDIGEDKRTANGTSCRKSSMFGAGADILELAAKLYQLPHNGPTIKKLLEEVSKCEELTHYHNKTFNGAAVVAKIKACVVGNSSESVGESSSRTSNLPARSSTTRPKKAKAHHPSHRKLKRVYLAFKKKGPARVLAEDQEETSVRTTLGSFLQISDE